MESGAQHPSRKLNLGCGTDIREGWVNLDSANIPGVDVVHNIELLPLPFGNNEFDEILCNDILEHIDYPPVLKEIYRILAPGGVVHIRVPHFTSKNNAVDPQHIRQFSVETFDFFCKGTRTYHERSYYFDFAFEAFARAPFITFDKKNLRRNKPVEWYVNRSPYRQRMYESTGFSRLFPALNIEVSLRK